MITSKIELNKFMLRKLKERQIEISNEVEEPTQNLIRNLIVLKEKFDKIVSHISDLSFVADGLKKQEDFSFYTKRVFLLAVKLREEGDEARRQYQDESLAKAKFESALSIIDELLFEMYLSFMIKEETTMHRNSLHDKTGLITGTTSL
jgi:hypothetical protein